jgi:hypothetical protein
MNSAEFPSTERCLLLTMLQGTGHQHEDLFQRLVLRYLDPLVTYARGSSLRLIADPIDLVQGYFAERLSRAGCLSRWAESGMPLRRWLVNGLHLYARDWRRRHHSRALPIDACEPASEHVPAAEAAWARALIRESCDRVEAELCSSGHPLAWDLFRMHFIDGIPYSQLTARFGMTPAAMAESSRRVSALLRTTVRMLLVREGVAMSDIDREILGMLQSMEDHPA